MGHPITRIMPVHERGLRQMATRVIEHSITHILPDHERVGAPSDDGDMRAPYPAIDDTLDAQPVERYGTGRRSQMWGSRAGLTSVGERDYRAASAVLKAFGLA